MKKILLLFASFYGKKDLPEKKRIFWEPLGMAYLASYLRKHGYFADVLYPLIEDMDEADVITWLKEKANDYMMIGLSTSDFSTSDVKKYVSIIRKIQYVGYVFLGGMGPTCNWREFVQTGVDAVIIGEGEKTILNVAQMIENGLDYKCVTGLAYLKNGEPYRNGKVKLIENLDENVFPARDISLRFLEKFDINQIHIQIQTSRGCLGSCSFCSISKFLNEQGGNKYRCRTAKSIVEEIAFLNQEYGFKKFDFMDENFFPFDKEKSIKKGMLLAEEMKKLSSNVELFVQCHLQAINNELLDILRNLNVTSIFVGIDSFQSSELFLFNKKYCREDVFEFLDIVQKSSYSFDVKSNFRIKTGFINFTPISTLATIYENGVIFKKYNFSCKKLIRKLRVNPGHSILVERIRSLFYEFSVDNYFMNKEVEQFYTSLMEFYSEYEVVRENMRNIENIYLNDSTVCSVTAIEKVVSIREVIDNLFYDFYFCRIKEIKDSIYCGSLDMRSKLLSLGEEANLISKKVLCIDNSVSYPINDRGV